MFGETAVMLSPASAETGMAVTSSMSTLPAKAAKSATIPSNLFWS